RLGSRALGVDLDLLQPFVELGDGALVLGPRTRKFGRRCIARFESRCVTRLELAHASANLGELVRVALSQRGELALVLLELGGTAMFLRLERVRERLPLASRLALLPLALLDQSRQALLQIARARFMFGVFFARPRFCLFS